MWIVNLLRRTCVCVCFPPWHKGNFIQWVFLCVFSPFGKLDSFSCDLQIYGLSFQPWIISDQQSTLIPSVLSMTKHCFLHMTWRRALSPEPVSIVWPFVPQEVMPGAGSGIAKGKRAANTFDTKWRAAGRKSTGLLLEQVWVFFSSDQNWFWRKKIRGEELFLIYSNNLSSCGIPWKWFSGWLSGSFRNRWLNLFIICELNQRSVQELRHLKSILLLGLWLLDSLCFFISKAPTWLL